MSARPKTNFGRNKIAAQDGKVGVIPSNIRTMAFLYSDCLYFLWHGIKDKNINARDVYPRLSKTVDCENESCYGKCEMSRTVAIFNKVNI